MAVHSVLREIAGGLAASEFPVPAEWTTSRKITASQLKISANLQTAIRCARPASPSKRTRARFQRQPIQGKLAPRGLRHNRCAQSPVSRESILISLRDPYSWIESSANIICPPSSFSRRLPPTNRDRSHLCGSLRAELIPFRCDNRSANRKTGHERLVQPRVR